MIVELEVFNGPLELILNLVEKEKIDIYDIAINQITESYLDSIKDMDVDSDDMVDFIVMASTLIEIKSKMMLAKEDDSDIDPREDLVQRLIEYKKTKIAAELLDDKKNIADMNYSRMPVEIVNEDKEINLSEDIEILKRYFQNLLIDREEHFIDRDIISSERFKVDDYINKIKHKLANKSSFKFSTLISQSLYKQEVLVYFMALLELVKNKSIRVDQYNNDIKIKLREDKDE